MDTVEATGTERRPEIRSAYEAYGPELRSYVTRDFGPRVAADDVVDEAFARLIRVTASDRAPSLVRPWLYRVAHNLAIDEFRRLRRLRRDGGGGDGREPLGSTPGRGADDIDAAISRTGIAEALATLPADARRSLLLSAAGYRGPEIAAMLGRSEGATRTLLCRSRRQLRMTLEARERGPDEPARPAA